MPFEDLGFAKVDHHRALRHGMPEVILGRGKTTNQVAEIAAKLLERSPNLLVTRADDAMAEAVKRLNIQLLVMGAYGHSRIRQLIVGSTTTTTVRTVTIPVLMFR